MALTPVSVPKYPTVPTLPGVPQMVRDPLVAAITVASPFINGIYGAFYPKYRILNAVSKDAIIPDTITELFYLNGSKLAQAPLEKGSFTDYNKVANPFEGTLRMVVGSTLADRINFLKTVEAMEADTNLYSIVTPEATYKNCNLERFDYRRTQRNGANLIEAHAHFKEIRQPRGTQYSNKSSVPAASRTNWTTSLGLPDPTNVKSPTAAAAVSLGIISPSTPATSTSNTLSGLLSSGSL